VRIWFILFGILSYYSNVNGLGEVCK